MSKVFAIVESGVVTNVINAESWQGGIDVTNVTPRPGPGWTYSNGVFTAPAPVVRERFNVLKAELLREMSPAEYATWENIAHIARTTTATQAQRRALKALAVFNAYPPMFDKRDGSFSGLKAIWVENGIVATDARADAIITAALTG
ncbi:MAG TPA: hypothetical protein VF680_17435 [Allosphingosinicella sp.]|jgi:hypothetical protein